MWIKYMQQCVFWVVSDDKKFKPFAPDIADQISVFQNKKGKKEKTFTHKNKHIPARAGKKEGKYVPCIDAISFYSLIC